MTPGVQPGRERHRPNLFGCRRGVDDGRPQVRNVIEQLKQLAELKDRGIFTDEEFAAQKARILGTS